MNAISSTHLERYETNENVFLMKQQKILNNTKIIKKIFRKLKDKKNINVILTTDERIQNLIKIFVIMIEN